MAKVQFSERLSIGTLVSSTKRLKMIVIFRSHEDNDLTKDWRDKVVKSAQSILYARDPDPSVSPPHPKMTWPERIHTIHPRFNEEVPE